MHYFIDGYNVLFFLQHVDNDLKHRREKIISNLNEQISFLALDVSIIFDAHKQKQYSRQYLDQLEIIYTDSQTADEYILEALYKIKKPKQEIVVTSDKQLARQVRALNVKVMEVPEFLEALNTRCEKKRKVIQAGISSKLNAQVAKNQLEHYLQIFENRWQKLKNNKHFD